MSIKAIETSYKGCRFRSRLEARWAVFFDAVGSAWDYEKEGFELGKAGRYLPDFWLRVPKLWVEIKPHSEDRTPEQQDATYQLCLTFSRAIGGRIALVEGSPWEHHILIFDGGHHVASGSLVELQAPTFYGLVVLPQPSTTTWYPLATYDSPMLEAASRTARSARFEHGETPQSIAPAPPSTQTKVMFTFKPGERVRHSLFGDGTILYSAPHGEGDQELMISFTTGKPKEMLASLARLTRI